MLPRGKGLTELTTLCPLCWMKPRQLLMWKLQLPEQGHPLQGQDFQHKSCICDTHLEQDVKSSNNLSDCG